MNKIFSIIFMIFCIFSFNTCFQINSAFAVDVPAQEFTQEAPKTIPEDKEDILDEPVFTPESQKAESKNMASILSSIVIKIIGIVLLVILVVFCCAFIWFANLQRKRDKRRKQQGADANVIDAVDNFARHRIK